MQVHGSLRLSGQQTAVERHEEKAGHVERGDAGTRAAVRRSGRQSVEPAEGVGAEGGLDDLSFDQ